MKQQRPLLGFLLAFNTAVFWGVLPIIMQQTLVVMDPVTVVWYRFVISAIGLIFFLGSRQSLPKLGALSKNQIIFLLLAALGLSGNYALFGSSLLYISPTASQILGQIGQMLLLIISVPIFKEHLRRSQLIGVLILVTGILLFFNNSLREIFSHFGKYSFGIMLATGASLIWTVYGLAQKILSRGLSSQQILLIVYGLCVLFLWPMAHPSKILLMNPWQLGCLIFCGLNTLVAYGSFGEALAIWQVAKTTATAALTPLFTLLFSDLMNLLWPNLFNATLLNWIGYIGAVLVVCGTVLSVLGRLRNPFRDPTKPTRLKQMAQP